MRGGSRPGAGRPKGAKDIRSQLDKARFQAEAQKHLSTALDVLVDVAENGKSESARVSAASEIMNRAVGRPAQTIDMDDFGTEILRYMLTADQEELEQEGLGYIRDIPLPNLFE